MSRSFRKFFSLPRYVGLIDLLRPRTSSGPGFVDKRSGEPIQHPLWGLEARRARKTYFVSGTCRVTRVIVIGKEASVRGCLETVGDKAGVSWIKFQGGLAYISLNVPSF